MTERIRKEKYTQILKINNPPHTSSQLISSKSDPVSSLLRNHQLLPLALENKPRFSKSGRTPLFFQLHIYVRPDLPHTPQPKHQITVDSMSKLIWAVQIQARHQRDLQKCSATLLTKYLVLLWQIQLVS